MANRRSLRAGPGAAALEGAQGFDAIESHERWLARPPEDRLSMDRVRTGDRPFDRKLGVSGAQPVDTMKQVLAKAWADRAESFAEGAVCGPDGCD